MSDDEFYEEEYFEWEEEPFNAVDDLAERTMHSPILIGCDASFDTLDYTADFDDSADEYHDFPDKSCRKRKRTTGKTTKHRDKKRTKLDAIDRFPPLESNSRTITHPPVLWQSKDDTLKSRELPIFQENQAKAVSLLKNWRELLASLTMQVSSYSNKTDVRKNRKKQKQSQVRPEISSFEELDLNMHALEGDSSVHGMLDEAAVELPPTHLTGSSIVDTSRYEPASNKDGTLSNLTKEPLSHAANVRAEMNDLDTDEGLSQSINVDGKLSKLSGISESQQDTRHENGPCREPDRAESKRKRGRPKGKRKAEASNEQPPAKKVATTRGSKTSTSNTVEPKTTRQTRSKKN